MPRDDHYAIVLTINRYPGLSDLHGPENDGEEFRQWLLDPEYGDLDTRRIQVIRSQDYGVAATPDDANPTEKELKKALNLWLRTPNGWHDRIGQRLYLFFAGHGFTAGSAIHDPALFSAVAQNGDTAHIAVLRYASKIANAGFFDEIILVTPSPRSTAPWSPRGLLPGRTQGEPGARADLDPAGPATNGTRPIVPGVWSAAGTSVL
ncbi:TPA: caspase family protein [Stenotrophomonas maltophilia]